jgi:hypothetical protein
MAWRGVPLKVVGVASLAVGLLAMSPVARAAANRERVAIVFAEDVDDRRGVVHDLALEFRAEGFDVGLIGKEVDDESLDVWADRARADGDSALIHVVPAAAGDAIIDVLLITPESLVLKDTIRRQPNDTSDMASVRAVEVTRAALIQVQQTRRAQPEVDIVREDPYAALVPSHSPHVALSVSPVVAITGTAQLTLIDLGMNLSWLPSDHLALELEGAIPLTQATESGSTTTAQVKASFVDLGASFFFEGKEATVRPYIALRAGGVLFSTTEGSFNGVSQNSLSFFNAVALGASIRLQGFMRLRLEVGVGISAAPPSLLIDGRAIDHLGLPLALFRTGPEASW